MKQIWITLAFVLLITPLAVPAEENYKKATFAGGCFWCMERPFDKLEGVISTTAGYTGGTEKNPTYKLVSAGFTGHTEAIQILYDPEKIDYRELLNVFWRNIDPTAVNRQFCDSGKQYRSAIFYHDESQRMQAEVTRSELIASGRFKDNIATQIVAAGEFWPAEEYHQDYYSKNPIQYELYRLSCGRDKRLKDLWEKEADK